MITTPDNAEKLFCPHTFNSQGAGQNCVGAFCMAWRWEPLLADEAFLAAVKKAEAETGLPHPKAAKHVTENRAKYGLPTAPFRGYCGLAGKP